MKTLTALIIILLCCSCNMQTTSKPGSIDITIKPLTLEHITNKDRASLARLIEGL